VDETKEGTANKNIQILTRKEFPNNLRVNTFLQSSSKKREGSLCTNKKERRSVEKYTKIGFSKGKEKAKVVGGNRIWTVPY
jgi:hypothetical protein